MSFISVPAFPLANNVYATGLSTAAVVRNLIGMNATDKVSVDPAALGTVFGGRITAPDAVIGVVGTPATSAYLGTLGATTIGSTGGVGLASTGGNVWTFTSDPLFNSDNTRSVGNVTNTPLAVNLYTARIKPVTFANLPAAPVFGWLAVVSDSNTAVQQAVIAGLGANKVLAFYNGTNWTVAGA